VSISMRLVALPGYAGAFSLADLVGPAGFEPATNGL
jgi:hypothetical protein